MSLQSTDEDIVFRWYLFWCEMCGVRAKVYDLIDEDWRASAPALNEPIMSRIWDNKEDEFWDSV